MILPIAMKTPLLILIAGLSTGVLHAEFRLWTRNDGKTADLELVSVSEADGAGQKSATFKTRNGQSVSITTKSFSTEDSHFLDQWKPSKTVNTEVKIEVAPSVFDKSFNNNLIKLTGKSLKTCQDATKPSKYYLLYYTASWCGPCHKFTPSLVEFYNKNKNDEFELVLITSDNDEDDMERYAEEMKMPWPQLKFSRVEKFKKEHRYPGRGIPNLVLTDLDGKLIKGSYEGTTYTGPTAVMKHLASLLKK